MGSNPWDSLPKIEIPVPGEGNSNSRQETKRDTFGRRAFTAYLEGQGSDVDFVLQTLKKRDEREFSWDYRRGMF